MRAGSAVRTPNFWIIDTLVVEENGEGLGVRLRKAQAGATDQG